MPLYSRDAIRSIWFIWSAVSPIWWRLPRWLLQTTVVIWLITRFLGSDLLPHIAVCLGVIIFSELRIGNCRNSNFFATFGIGSWQALRALHERLDDLYPPTDAQRTDEDAQIDLRPVEPGTRDWGIADSLDPYGTDPIAAAARPRHWGTSFLRRELGNLRKAQRVAGWSHDNRALRGLPTRLAEDGEGTAFFYQALASLALVWAMIFDVFDATDIRAQASKAGVMLVALFGIGLALHVAENLADRRSEKPQLDKVNELGIAQALARMPRRTLQSSWTITRGNESLSATFYGRRVWIRRGDRLLFCGDLNGKRSKLRSIELCVPGEWVELLHTGQVECEWSGD